MIGKILKGSSFLGLIKYGLNIEKGNLIASNMIGTDNQLLADQMELVTGLNKNISEPVKHFILSFSPEDAISMTDELMVKISEEYLMKMGFDNNQFLVSQHLDTEILHMHIVTNRIKYDGSVVKDNLERVNSRNILIDIEKKYGLSRTADAYKSTYEAFDRNKVIYNYKSQTEEQLKKHLREQIKFALSEHPISMDKLANLLLKKGIEVQVADNKQGVSFMVGDSTFKGSSLSKTYTYNRLSSRLLGNAHYQFYQAIEESLKEPNRSFDEFSNSLNKKGFNAALNKAGNGWSIAKDGVEIKGYDLKRMSFKNINDLIDKNIITLDKKVIRESIFSFLKDGGDNHEKMKLYLEDKGISLSYTDEVAKLSYKDVVISDHDIGGRVSKIGLSDLLYHNKIDNILEELVSIGTTNDNIISRLSNQGVEMVDTPKGISYKMDFKIINGNSLFRNKDSQITRKLENNKIRNVVQRTVKNKHGFNEFVKSLNNEGVQVVVDGTKLRYTTELGEISVGKMCDISWINSHLSGTKNHANYNKGIKIGNLTAKSREGEDEEDKRKRKNEDNYGQTM